MTDDTPVNVTTLGEGSIRFYSLQHGKNSILLICPHEAEHPPDLAALDRQIAATKSDEQDFSLILDANGGDAFLYFTNYAKACSFAFIAVETANLLLQGKNGDKR